MKSALIIGASILVLLAITTWAALEWSGVAIIETRAPDGSLRATHVWFAEPDGELWIEAGTPQNPWYRDIQRDPNVSFDSAELSGRFVARRIAKAGARDQLRILLRDKYGLRDWWVGVLFDTSSSIAVELVSSDTSKGSDGR